MDVVFPQRSSPNISWRFAENLRRPYLGRLRLLRCVSPSITADPRIELLYNHNVLSASNTTHPFRQTTESRLPDDSDDTSL